MCTGIRIPGRHEVTSEHSQSDLGECSALFLSIPRPYACPSVPGCFACMSDPSNGIALNQRHIDLGRGHDVSESDKHIKPSIIPRRPCFTTTQATRRGLGSTHVVLRRSFSVFLCHSCSRGSRNLFIEILKTFSAAGEDQSRAALSSSDFVGSSFLCIIPSYSS